MTTRPTPRYRAQPRRRPLPEAGFTLLAVVAVVFLLSLVVVTLMRTTSSLMTTARFAEQHAAAEYLADGLTRLVTRHLSIAPMDDLKSGSISVSGLPTFCSAGPSAVSIAVTLVQGQIDLNAASAPLLAHILRGAGLTEDKAQEITRDIIDYRAPGDTSITGDSKSTRYAASGRSLGAKSAPFATVQELDQLPSMTRNLYEVLKPLFTVQSGQRYVDPLRASYPVSRALNGMGLDRDASIAAEDQLTRLRRETVLPPDLRVPAKTRSERRKSGTSFLIEVMVVTSNGAVFKRETITDVVPGSGQPGATLDWSQGDVSSISRPPRRGPLPPCVGELLWTSR